MVYLKLFLSFLQIGLFSFGGGYGAMPLIRDQVVVENSWLSMQEFADLITLSQMTPGPIAVNSATFVGMKIAGVLGAVCATAGCILPSCTIVTVLAKIYFKYRNLNSFQTVLGSLRPGVTAMIAAAGVSIAVAAFWTDGFSLASTEWVLVAAFVLCLVLLRKTKLNPVLIMLLAGAVNTVYRLAVG